MNSVFSQLRNKMSNKDYRDAFVAEQIFSRLPLKIRMLREERDLSQKELGDRAGGMAQAWVSKLEDPNYGKLTISTLLRIASAFDVGLHIDFVPFSQVLTSATSLSRESFSVRSFGQDLGFADQSVAASISAQVTSFSSKFANWGHIYPQQAGSPVLNALQTWYTVVMNPSQASTPVPTEDQPFTSKTVKSFSITAKQKPMAA